MKVTQRTMVTDMHRKIDRLQEENAKLLDALEQLGKYVTNNPRRYQSRNPYTVPAIENALRTIVSVKGHKDYFGALNGVEDRFQESL